jgi:hypothetical protein
MGFSPENRVWVSTRGGDVLLAEEPGIETEQYNTAKLASRGFGVLAVG